MRLVFHEDGILSQFEGYEQLEEFDWEGYRSATGTSVGSTGSSRTRGILRIGTRSRSKPTS